MTTAASRKTYLDAILISRCRSDDTFVAFQPMEIFRFWRNGKFTFFQRSLQPHPLPPTQLNLPPGFLLLARFAVGSRRDFGRRDFCFPGRILARFAAGPRQDFGRREFRKIPRRPKSRQDPGWIPHRSRSLFYKELSMRQNSRAIHVICRFNSKTQ